jgi:hypothetical protein
MAGHGCPGSSDLAGTEAVRRFEESMRWELEVDWHRG